MSPINYDIKNSCFFCSEPIIGKKTQEHIISNSLLGKLGIKEETLSGKGKFQYSRIKVPAHDLCNSTFGSQYENEILKLLDSPEDLFYDIQRQESRIFIRYGPDKSSTLLVSTWMAKIYYGLFYNDYLKVNDLEYKATAKEIIDSDNFRIIQNAYKDGVGFYLPSSLYVFKSAKEFFDLQTFICPPAIMLKIQKIVFILIIGDGYLTKNYLNGKILDEFRKYLANEENNNNNFPLHLYALAELIALKMCIPKTPAFIYSSKEIINLSLSSSVDNPKEYYKVDEVLIEKTRNEILKIFNVKLE
jgi:hypothetical protein